MLLDDDQPRRGPPSSTRCCRPASTTPRSTPSWPRIAGEAEAVRGGHRAPTVHVHADRPLEPAAPEPPQHADATAAGRRQPELAEATFPEGDQLVVLDADGVTEVVIPVEARSNGTSSLEVSLLTPAFGQDVTAPSC